MRILLFGGSGQLGGELIKRGRDLNFDIASPVSSEIDVASIDQVRLLCERLKPNVIINSAAYTAVDKAEDEPDNAFRINRDGARVVAMAAKDLKARLLHISTDYVFDGSLGKSYTEDSPPKPLGIYGQSKFAGEQEVLSIWPDNSLIVRTSWLHGMYGANFVRTMLQLYKTKSEVRVVNDQWGSPTWAGWLAEVLLDLARLPDVGIVNATCGGEATWYDFAKAILDEVRPSMDGVSLVKIIPQSTAESGRKAPRPKFSVLNSAKLTGILGRPVMHWRDGLRAHLHDIQN